MSITKERRDAIRAYAPHWGGSTMRFDVADIIALIDALDAADTEAAASMAEIARLREELEAAEAMIIPNPVAWTSADNLDLMAYLGADTPYEAYMWSEPTIAHNIPLYRRASVAKTVACGGCGTSDPESRCIGCLHDFYAAPPVSDPVAWQYRDRRLADPTWHYVPDADFREAIGMHPKIYEVRPLYAAPPGASLELAKSALQDYPIGRVLPLSTEGAQPAAEPVKVKPLEWKKAFWGGKQAQTFYGRYSVGRNTWSATGFEMRDPDCGDSDTLASGEYDTEQEALDAAQALHEANICSTLISPAPSS